MKKKERIIGLVIGLFGLLFLFHFSFTLGEFLTDYSILIFSVLLSVLLRLDQSAVINVFINCILQKTSY